ncbi:MAG: DUF2163 domain-containing protein [Novosphingobium sp.]
MSRVWFATELETVATFWRVERGDGVTLGFTSHDRDLWFDGVRHLAAPGMVPSAIRRSTALEPDGADMQGALDHAAIRADDLAAGRFDGARVSVGVVDWESLEASVLFAGRIGAVGQDGSSFSAELVSAKIELAREVVPRTAPTCRAEFCGPGCALSVARFSHESRVTQVDPERGAVQLASPVQEDMLVSGTLRWIDGARAGIEMRVLASDDGWLLLDRPVTGETAVGTRAVVVEGCDHTLETCAGRFANAVNFQGEPFLPGNDLLTRYGQPGE